jgi:polysaccharide biosynthesis/export protein
MRTLVTAAFALAWLGQSMVLAQTASTSGQRGQPSAASTPAPVGAAFAATDAAYVIGLDDVLGVLFWREQEMSGDVTVRPDGMITLPLLRDIKAAGFTPGELADHIQEAAREYLKDPSVTVVVRQMNSRQVFITGEVARPGVYPLTSTLTVMQLIAIAGGLTEFARSKGISVMRLEAGQTRTFKFHYNDVAQGKKREQNLVLRPGDTVVVPEK